MIKAEVIQREFYDAYGVSVVTIEAHEAGALLEQHQHDISHLTYIAAGSVRPIVDGKDLPELKAGQTMIVEAFKTHCFLTLEQDTRLLCITNTLGAASEKDRRVPGGPHIIPPEFKIEG